MKRSIFILLTLLLCPISMLLSQLSFEEVSIQSGLLFDFKESLKMGGGAASFDYDNDGDDDIYIVGGQNSDALFENDGHGNFTNVSLNTNISQLTDSIMTTSVVTGDIDNDGRREIFVGTMGVAGHAFASIKANLLLKFNEQSHQYEDVSHAAGLTEEAFCMGAHMFDANQDGLLDIYVINYVEEPSFIQEGGDVVGFDHVCHENSLYINTGNGIFDNRTSNYGLDIAGCSLAATSSDLDGDGDPDLLIANDFGKWLEPNQLFRNDGSGQAFVDISAVSNTNAQMYGMGIGVGDYDEDLDMDFYVTNIGENYFFRNEGDMVFTNMAPTLDVQNEYALNGLLTTGWGAILEDFNNDSYLDIFVSNGYVYSVVDIDDEEQYDELYTGSSEYDFTPSTPDCGIDFTGPSRGALYGDWNRDGRLDMMTITNEYLGNNIENSINYYKNNSNSGYWIGFELEGVASNRDAYGTRVVLHSGHRSLLRELRGGDSHASQNSSIIHFGLGDMWAVDSVEIHWPSGIKETIQNPEIGRYHFILEGSTTSTQEVQYSYGIDVFPNPAYMFLDVRVEMACDIQLKNSLGQVVLQKSIPRGTTKIETSHLSPGLYTLTAYSNHSLKYTTKIILSP